MSHPCLAETKGAIGHRHSPLGGQCSIPSATGGQISAIACKPRSVQNCKKNRQNEFLISGCGGYNVRSEVTIIYSIALNGSGHERYTENYPHLKKNNIYINELFPKLHLGTEEGGDSLIYLQPFLCLFTLSRKCYEILAIPVWG